MADTVSTTTLFNGSRRLIVKLTNLSDGTGESNVVKVDKSTFTGPRGGEPSYFSIEKVKYDVLGMRVKISIDHTTDETTLVLQGFGEMDFRDVGGLTFKGAGDTGDILLTTSGQASGDGYDITLYLRKVL